MSHGDDDGSDDGDDGNDDDDRGYQLSSNEPDTNFSTQPLNPKLPNYFTNQIWPTCPQTDENDNHDDEEEEVDYGNDNVNDVDNDEEGYGDDNANDDDPPRTTCMFNTLSCTSSKMSFGNCRTNSARTRKLSRSLLWPAPT